ncbi:tyrosine-type recombinase/integrase [Sporolactobacillus sp. CPB3-1]|uniref:Tyrosine-type recombinase/integrase n=1 Tax=Sporolactobacillus mangiferae TaxID=2940498 RepID=A0ABT0MAK9_9BACL|nr:tyrosine-type recombinase/integrase [Sporolactobacillus mangiferae]MCL1631905.1 tyrosine-type recombinase/integrase [Sporolactobacillus mangiferae]
MTKKENTPKTVSSICAFNIVSEVENVLHHQHARLSKLSIVYPIFKDNNLVFPQLKKNYMGKQYTQGVLYHEMKQINKRCSFQKKLTPHKLRHTFTSLAADAGIPLDDIRAVLGHHDDELTRKIYEHVTKTDAKKISHKFGEFMRHEQ